VLQCSPGDGGGKVADYSDTRRDQGASHRTQARQSESGKLKTPRLKREACRWSPLVKGSLENGYPGENEQLEDHLAREDRRQGQWDVKLAPRPPPGEKKETGRSPTSQTQKKIRRKRKGRGGRKVGAI